MRKLAKIRLGFPEVNRRYELPNIARVAGCAYTGSVLTISNMLEMNLVELLALRGDQ